jgi:hypothetical protein
VQSLPRVGRSLHGDDLCRLPAPADGIGDQARGCPYEVSPDAILSTHGRFPKADSRKDYSGIFNSNANTLPKDHRELTVLSG